MTVSSDFNHNVQAVFKALTDPKYLVDRSLALGELCADCEVSEDEKRATITMVREVRRELPGVLAKLFDPVNVMDMTEEWQANADGWSGNWTMTVRGQPVTIQGRFELAPTSDGCRYSVSHRARAKVPMIGEQVKKFILGQTTRGAEDELEYLRNYLG